MSEHRINVTFSGSTYAALRELAERRGKSMSEVLRDAVAREKWLDDALAEGGRLLIKQDGEVRELVML
jgi:predicted transcriptional regulator